jgi:hypothetical protein
MAKITQSDGKTNQWWHIEHLIAKLDADRDVKCLLFLIHLHTNARRGCAWAKQETLAWEMNVSLSTLERAFRTAKQLGVLDVRRIRTGKRPDEQYNEYWIVIDRVEKLQRTEPQHPSPMTGDTDEHPSPVKGDSEPEHPSFVTPNTRHLSSEHPSNQTGTPVTRDGEGFEVKQVASNSGYKTSSSETATPDPDDDVKKIEKLYRDHPRFVELCSRIVLQRAQSMRKTIASPERYVRGALPSLLREPDLLTEISFTLGDDFKDAWPLYDAGTKSFFGASQSLRHTARPEPKYITSEYGPPGERPPEVQAEISRIYAEYKAKYDMEKRAERKETSERFKRNMRLAGLTTDDEKNEPN